MTVFGKNTGAKRLANAEAASGLVFRCVISFIGTVALAAFTARFNSSPHSRLEYQLLIASLVYIGCGRPLHERASMVFSRKRIDRYGVLSITASAFYWYSVIVSIAWIFYPRYFPLRWLDANLAIPTYFVESCGAVFLGLGLLLVSVLRKGRK